MAYGSRPVALVNGTFSGPKHQASANGQAHRLALTSPLPTWALKQVGGYLGYTGRAADVVARAARDRGCVKTLSLFWKVEFPFQWARNSAPAWW